jgi:uncharacterized membrane protein (DUF2068 family)
MSLLGELKMEISKGLRLLAASLILFDGIGHLAAAAFATELEMAVLALFGVLYIALGVGLFAGRRLFSYLGVVIPIVGVSIGTYSYVARKPEPVILAFVSIAIVVILCCCYLVLHKTQ